MASEPYDVRKLTRWLTDTYRPTLLPQSDAIWHAYELPSGRTVVIPGPSAAKRPVSTGTAKKIATDLGMSFSEFRAAVGHPIIKHGKPKSNGTRPSPNGCSKGDVLARIADVRRALIEVEQAVKPGVRDKSFYRRVHERLADVHRQAYGVLAEATRTGA